MKYSLGAVVLHWLIGILIAMNIGIAWRAEDLPKPLQLEVYGYHKAWGILILLLVVLRIVWRLTHTPPPLSPGLKTWEAGLAKAVHSLLYVLMLAIPLAGWALHSAFSGGKPVSVFGLFSFPGLPFAADKARGELFAEIHGTLATVLIALVALHVLGSLKHQFLDRDGNLRRMWFGRGL